jgi:CHAT domain-containing protein
MKKTQFTFLIIFWCVLSNINAQSSLPKSKADSLWTVWQDERKSDSSRIESIFFLAKEGYLKTNPDSAVYFAEMQYVFSKNKKIIYSMAQARNLQGAAENILSNYKKALEYFQEAFELYNSIGEIKLSAALIGNKATIFHKLGQVDSAFYYYNKSLQLRESLGDQLGSAGVLRNIGSLYNSQGRYIEAIYYLEQSLALRRISNDSIGIINTLNSVAVLYSNLNYFEKSIEILKECIELSELVNDKRKYAMSLVNMGNILMEQGDYTKCLDFFYKGLTLLEDSKDLQGKSTTMLNIGMANHFDKNYENSLIWYHKSLLIFEEIGFKAGISVALRNLGDIYAELKNYEKSEEYQYRALKESKFLQDHVRIRESVISFYKLNILKRDNIQSYRYLIELYELAEVNLKTNYIALSEEEKIWFFSNIDRDFQKFYDFTLSNISNNQGLVDTCYNIALQNKGLTLKSSTAMRTAIQNSGDTTLINEYENWLSLKKQIAKDYESGKEIKDLENQANEMERGLVKSSTIFSDFDKVRNLKWQDVQAGLKPGEAAIEFVHFKSEIDTANPIIYAALIVKKDSKHPEMIRLCTEAELKEILGVFQGNNLSFVKGVYGTKSKAEKALYEKIWQPIEKHLEGIQNIYYSPSGLLHKVSFAAISKGDNVFLCDNYQLHQQSSTGKVALPSNVMYDSKDAYLLMGGVQYNTDKTKKEVWSYLPGTLNETDNIQSFLEKKKHSVNLFAANDANETNFKKQAQKANVLHISTHGFFYPDPEQVREEVKKNEVKEENIIFRGTEALDSAERSSSLYANWSFVINKNPLMRSGLVLAGANDVWQRNALEEGEDGILTAQEVSNLDLRNTKLVVLSACETGLGDIKGSEGVFGLQRAFKMAGAEYLIMSLWQVPDKETAEFMELFYKNLVKVKDIPKAFNQTQQAMRKKYDPYYWAAFVLIN